MRFISTAQRIGTDYTRNRAKSNLQEDTKVLLRSHRCGCVSSENASQLVSAVRRFRGIVVRSKIWHYPAMTSRAPSGSRSNLNFFAPLVMHIALGRV